MATELKDFYLRTSMGRYEYMRMPIWMIHDTTIKLYNLLRLVDDGFVFVDICRGRYGLPQAGRHANDQLIALLAAPHGCHRVAVTPGL